MRACASSERRGRFGKQLSSESQCSRSGSSHSHRAWPWAPIPARPHPTRPLPDRPRATVHIQRQRPVHRVTAQRATYNVEKLLSKNVLQLALQKTTFLLQKHRFTTTADTSFLQNQPVTARGINNKNFHVALTPSQRVASTSTRTSRAGGTGRAMSPEKGSFAGVGPPSSRTLRVGQVATCLVLSH